MNIEEIGRIAELMKEFDLNEFCLKSADMQLKMRRGGRVVDAPLMTQGAPAMAVAAPPAAHAASAAEAEEAPATGETIDSPIVGTFYAAPAPDAPSFVKVGDRVEPDTVVCIVEAMKVMNEIKAETSGVIKRILVDNATPVEFGQPMFEIETD